MNPDISQSSALVSTALELPEGMDLLDDLDLPSLDDLLLQFCENSDNGVLQADCHITGSCCGHTSPCSQASVGPSAGLASKLGERCLHTPEGESALMATGTTAVPFNPLDSSCSTGHGRQLADSAQATLSQHQVERPTSSNDSNPCEESPQSSSDVCHKRRRMADGDAASSGEQEDGGP
ncbi:hypothetical protein COCSUDRAFT_64925, partial [Coccomyxa subellipsoidea C-169]